jgi:hypothetical protein
MIDTIIAFLLEQNPKGWRGQALMLKSAEEDGRGYLAVATSYEKSVQSEGDTGLLDLFRDTLHEIEVRSRTRPDFMETVSYWVFKKFDAEDTLESINKTAANAFQQKMRERLR